MALFMNATASFGASPTTINDVQSIEVTVAGERLTNSSDVDTYLSWQAVVKRDGTARVVSNDVAQVAGYEDVVGVAAAALSLVAKTADGGSDCTIAGSAMITGCNVSAEHAAVSAGNTIEFGLVSATGTATPLTVS